MDDIPSTLFSASYTKLDRARQFIRELQTAADDYVASDPASARLDGPSNQMIITLQPISSWPGAIVGDAIHNLRSALDLMASELASMNGLSDKNIYFPFSNAAESFDDAIKSRKFHRAGEDAVALVKSFEPYSGSNNGLRAIHDLDVEDKHTALILTTSTVTIGFRAQYDINDVAAGKAELNIKGFHYIFPPDRPFAGAKVVETLESLVNLVESIIEAFACMVYARGS